MPLPPHAIPPEPAQALAASWRTMLAQASSLQARGIMPQRDKELAILALAEFIAASLEAGQTLLLVVPDDAWLPELSNALNLALRPLCLVLPGPGYAAGIALRATLALLKSRLARGGEDAWHTAWDAQRRRLEQHAGLWQVTLDWSAAGRTFSAWPDQVSQLFPVCILTNAYAETLAGPPRDLLLLLQPERMTGDLTKLLTLGKRSLLLQDDTAAADGRLVPIDEETRLSGEYELLAQELGEMELEFATVQAELAEFTRIYHARVGIRLAELDTLQARIACCQAERDASDAASQRQAEQAQVQAERSSREHQRFIELDRESEKPFAPSNGLKRLFRQLAQKIHPDRAEDEADRAWRTDLMSEANRAYRAGDEMVLQEILNQWQSGRHHQRTDPVFEGSALVRQIARMQRRLAEIETELNRLIASRLYELFAASNLAQQRGRDLLQEMVEQLDAQIDAARKRLKQLEPAAS